MTIIYVLLRALKAVVVAYFKVLSQHLFWGTEKIHEKPAREWNPETFECESGILTTRPRYWWIFGAREC